MHEKFLGSRQVNFFLRLAKTIHYIVVANCLENTQSWWLGRLNTKYFGVPFIKLILSEFTLTYPNNFGIQSEKFLGQIRMEACLVAPRKH